MIGTTHTTAENPAGSPPRAGPQRRTPYVVSALLAVAVAAGCAPTFFLPALLSGPEVMNGSARGTALVMLVVALPVLLGAMTLARRGSDRALIVWLGTAAYLTYNAVMLLFATPFNPLFLFYLAMLALAVATLATLPARVDTATMTRRLTAATPARPVAVYMWAVVTINALVWLRAVVPALGDAAHAPFLRGTGMTTSPVYVQDLALWLPFAAVVAWWLWQRRPWGLVAGGAYLTMWALESLTIATDQWFGHRADPLSPVASLSVVAPFAAFALLGCAPLILLLRDQAQD
ncbi:hypothetical protein J5X84_43080 [Streptosporangiaceae bacterium NEAU-GS5]|nr:hypothetical protein [Streptosporangiaceae bacterium NEAU-GS5]